MANRAMWFKKSDALDAELREQFGAELDRALRGELEGWKATPRGTVAFIVLLDQIARNVRRGTPGAFAGDPQALAACLEALDRGLDRELGAAERWFLYMPLMHSEDVGHQRRCVALFERLAEETSGATREALGPAVPFAVRHLEIIERFGRFPHRNEVLGRVSTEEEIAFLKEPNSSF
ncbi:MAG: DUF924 domain-containing protein [Polyangiaceae bacterium]|nr:DUF924 domain-containing protein [Polyangiaceae bacterium]